MQSAGKRQDMSAARAPQDVASCSPGAADAGQQDTADGSKPQPAQDDKVDVPAPAQGSSRPAAIAAVPADADDAAKVQLQRCPGAAR